MKYPGFLLRFLTLVTYFLPFVFYMSTCVGDEYRTAYNKKDALQNEREAFSEKLNSFGEAAEEVKNSISENNSPDSVKLALIDSFRNEIHVQLESTLNTGEAKASGENTGQNILWFIVSPTYYSISGIGSLFLFKDLAGKILMGFSLLLTLTSLLLWKFIKRKKIGVLILGANLVSMLALAIDSIVNDIELLLGFWMLLALLTSQLISEILKKRKASASVAPD